jgi:peptidoglycan/LPS O-acetylase OafA/YrhL
MTTWLVGVLFGYLYFQHKQRQFRLPRLAVITGWTLSLLTIFGVLYIQSRLQQFDYNPSSNLGDAFFEAFRGVLWATALSWLIFACHSGNAGLINDFLCLPFWTPISKLSYALYLLHLPIQLVISMSLKVPSYYSDFGAIHKFWGDFAITFLVSWIWAMAFEYPFLILSVAFLKKK